MWKLQMARPRPESGLLQRFCFAQKGETIMSHKKNYYNPDSRHGCYD
jgi:hypothetical protein